MRKTLTIDDDVTAAPEQTRKSREQTIRALAGWLTQQEATELREAVKVFDQIQEGD